MNGNIAKLLAIMTAVTSHAIVAPSLSVADAEPVFRLKKEMLGEIAPADPRDFSFEAVERVRSFDPVASNSVDMVGQRGRAELRIAEVEDVVSLVSVNGGPFVAAPLEIAEGSTIRLQAVLQGPSTGTSYLIPVSVGETTTTWRVRAADEQPEPVVVPAVVDAELGGAAVSQAVRPAGYDVPIEIAAAEADVAFSIEGAGFARTATLSPGQAFRISATAASGYAAERSIEFSVGLGEARWSIVTGADDQPDPFSIKTSEANDPNAAVVSETVQVFGFEGPVAIRAVGGTLSVEGRPFSAEGVISAGQSFRVGAIADPRFGATTAVTVSVGRGLSNWTIRTRERNTTPEPFAFGLASEVDPTATVRSSPVIVRGFDGPVSAAAGDGLVSVNGAPPTATAMVMPGDTLVVSAVAPSGFQTRRTVGVTVGTRTASWELITRSASSCTAPGGDTVAHGRSVRAYRYSTRSSDPECSNQSEMRTCDDGRLSGSYSNWFCEVPRNVSVTCTSMAGSTQTIQSRADGQDPIVVRAPSNAGTWLIYRRSPYLNCHDSSTVGSITPWGTPPQSQTCRSFGGNGYGNPLATCSWR